MKIKIIIFIDKNKVLAKSRKQFRNDLSSDFLEDETSFSKFIKTDKLLDQIKQEASIFEKKLTLSKKNLLIINNVMMFVVAIISMNFVS